MHDPTLLAQAIAFSGQDHLLTAGLLGLLIGAVLGLTGAGGGIFAVPALVFGLDMDLQDAAPLALLAVGMAAGVGAVQGLRQGIVRYRAAMALAAAGALTAPLGLHLARSLPAQWLNALFVAVMFVAAYRMLQSSRAANANEEAARMRAKPCQVSPETGRLVWNLRTAATLGAVGVVSGLFTGMLGVGGGFIIVPALAYFSALRMHSIVSTSLLVIALLSGVTISVAWSQGMPASGPAWMFALAAVAGMVAGRRLAPRLSSSMTQRLFALACVCVAAMLLLRSIGQ